MENITLEYQPFRFLKYTRTFHCSFPSGYDELSPAQFVAIARLVNTKITETDFLKIMTGIRKISANLLSDFERYNLMKLFDPFMEVKPYNAFIIPEIYHYNKIFCAPKFKLSGVTFAQFIFVESFFTDYQTDKKTINLHKFIASLYLLQNHSFNENEINENAALISKIKPEIIEAIVINYVLIREWLAQSYPLIFEQGEEETTEEKPKPKTHKNPGNSGWIKIFENIVGDDLINHDRYALLPLHNVLRWMTTKIKESRKNK